MQTFAYLHFKALNEIETHVQISVPATCHAPLLVGLGLTNEILAAVLKAMKSRSSNFTSNQQVQKLSVLVSGLGGILQGAMSGEVRKHGAGD